MSPISSSPVDGSAGSWLGIEVQPLLKGSGQTNGVLVGGVVEDSPASRAGFKSDDILLRLDGKDINVRFDEEIPLLNLMVAALPIGKEVEAVVLRDGKLIPLKVRTAEREPADLKQYELKQWGMTVRDISLFTAKEMKLEDRKGVLVTSVRPGGPCGEAKPAIRAGDILKLVNGNPIHNVAGLTATTAELTRGKKSPVPTTVNFNRKTERFLAVVKVGIQELEDPGLEARKAWLPVAIQVITGDIAEQLGSNTLTGVRITQVYSNSTAAAAGLRVGDLIVGLDAERIPASQPGDEEVFTSLIRQYRVGDRPVLSVLRDGQPLTIPVELARSPKLEREMRKFQDANFEFTARDLSFFDRVENDLPENLSGVLATEVKDGGWAALGELSAGDIIQVVNDKPVPDVAALETTMNAIAREKPKFIVLRVLRGIHTRYLELEPNWSNGK